jgi:hypothetical protein
VGPDAVYATLVDWLDQLGLRKSEVSVEVEPERVTPPVGG